ncbi:DoxX family protein [Nibribacter koreensis]|uniref:DoxX protein n=1 Tax=Nibribacter koreensis TaxID=1084519 RepID=A0ABP8FTH5_9BACT
MSLATKLDQLHLQARSNRWLWLFAIFLRVALAFGFITSGMVKVLGNRFTVLPDSHPMGNFLEAIYNTGFYYTAIGVFQVLAAVLLLFPRTVILGVFIYLPIILNICLLSISVRFEGSFVTSPLMVLANLYLLCWYYHRWKYVLPFAQNPAQPQLPTWSELNPRFPVKFFAGVATAMALVVLFAFHGYELMPRNTSKDCKMQCEDSANPQACITFCDCIHLEGQPLQKCLEAYENAR